jgi:hypothetical protein
VVDACVWLLALLAGGKFEPSSSSEACFERKLFCEAQVSTTCMDNKRFELLSEAQWELIEPQFPEPKRRKDKRGRPRAFNRACLEGILWLLQTGAAWRFLPDKYPSPAICSWRLEQ